MDRTVDLLPGGVFAVIAGGDYDDTCVDELAGRTANRVVFPRFDRGRP